MNLDPDPLTVELEDVEPAPAPDRPGRGTLVVAITAVAILAVVALVREIWR